MAFLLSCFTSSLTGNLIHDYFPEQRACHVKNKETEEKPDKKIRKLGISVHILLSFEKFSVWDRLVNR